jgi:hypothetical protein
MEGPKSEKWLEAMKSKIWSMYDNEVWTLVDIYSDRKAIENKRIFKKNTDADSNVTVYKARLIVKGFRQIHGVDYNETFSPVAMLKSIRILLAIAAYFDYEIWQMDVKTAFLNGNIEDELYMVQPEGFSLTSHYQSNPSTRPDVALALSLTSHYQSNPSRVIGFRLRMS